jgi:hypothetical protein
MERGITLEPDPEDRGGWRSALRNWRDNPLYLRLALARRRGTRGNKIARYAAPIIAVLPAGIAAAGSLLDRVYLTRFDYEAAFYNTIVTYVITACVIWFAQGFHQAMMDCMLLLNRSQRKQVTVTLDDLSAVSGISNHEIAVGALAAILPRLWLRIVVVAGWAMFVYLVYSTEFLDRLCTEQLVAMLFAVPTIAAVSLGGILATIALGLYLISLSENYSFSLASAVAVLYSLGALAWAPFSTLLAVFMMEFSGNGILSGGTDQEAWRAGQLMAPLAFILLVWLALAAPRAARWLRPVYALGSPWLNPVLLVVVALALMAFSGDWAAAEVSGITMLCLMYQLGTFAPLSMTHLPTLTMLGMDYAADGMALQILTYAVHVGIQLLLIWLCGRYAILAIADRRQSQLS